MGRFDSTVEFYAKYREPYPAEFFRQVAEKLELHGSERLLDTGCGPAQLAIGFQPFVGSCTGLDPEPEMIAAAREEAEQAGVRLELIQGRVEDLPADAGLFNLVTVGRALHWFDRDRALETLDRIVAPGGAIAICAAISPRSAVNPWGARFHEVRMSWADPPDESCYRIDFEKWFDGTRFQGAGRVEVMERRQVTVHDLVQRALSMSNTSPAVLGDRRADFEVVMAEALEPFSANGILEETVVAGALIFR
ncbi:MAG TPA: methyltransferase domain-containing protein [Bryobacteraceae bacterium]|nr:methyltransferase domain-containing protein [Bryobacteraceae bacterium]